MMIDAIDLSLKMQQAVILAAFSAAGIAVANWMRLMQGEHALLGPHAHRRSDELHVQKDVVPTGARWTDHYGKRSHDVDVEHMR